MKLHDLKRSSWLTDKAKRRGRWNSSGRWNYSWKWMKWQKARTWYSRNPGFEWGQTSLVQRRPKHKWFKRYFKLLEEISVVNLWTLNKDERIKEKDCVNKKLLKEFGYIKKESAKVKILWNWDFSKVLDFDGIDLFSKTASDKIQKAGAKILEKKSEKKSD